jgi:hypothetical protein
LEALPYLFNNPLSCLALLPCLMESDELAFLEEMLESAELLDCVTCQEDTLHVYEEVISVADGLTEVIMRCTSCMSCRPHLLID